LKGVIRAVNEPLNIIEPPGIPQARIT